MVGTLLLAFAPMSRVEAQEGNPTGEADTETYIHVVVKGDTLWDICDSLYGNPWVWPKIWQLNPFITNPHWIYPGTELRVYYRVPGYMEGRTVVEETVPGVVPEGVPEEGAPAPELLPTPVPPPPPAPKAPSMTFSEIDQVGFITPFVPKGGGLIVGEERQRKLIGAADRTYLQLRKSADPEVGKLYFVFKTSLLIRHPITRKKVGYLNTILGVVEVREVSEDHAKALVRSSYQSIAPGDKLMPYKKRSEEITLQPGAEPIEGNIILAEWDTYLIAQRQIVFIDLGANDEIKAGHRFEVFKEPRALTSQDEEVVLSIQPIGELMVLAVEQETAAALVTESLGEFTPGERVRLKTRE